MIDPKRRAALILFLAAYVASAGAGDDVLPMNTLTPAEQSAGWQLLFDGESLAGWRGYHDEAIPSGWAIVDGTLHFSGDGPGGGDIVTGEIYGDFELALEWKLSPGGNSGIFYRAEPGSEAIYRSAPEMQVLDDTEHADGANPLTSAGANYGLDPAPRGVVRPVGEWNQVRIRIEDNRVEHWLNGRQIVAYELRSEAWQAKVAASKFSDWPEYGQANAGHIGLQDHSDPVWYRNIRIRRLD